MILTDKQQQIVSKIDNWVNGILAKGGGDEDILIGMYDYMEGFKYLLDTLDNGNINILCNHHEGFYRFAKALENLAVGVQSGDIDVP